MAVNLSVPGKLLEVPGIQMGTARTGIKSVDRDDIAVFSFAPGTTTAGVYTQSSFIAPPVQLARERQAYCRAWVINSGNANAATGELGHQDADAVCNHVAERLDIDLVNVLPFSTGVIGERLNVPALQRAVTNAVANLCSDAWLQTAAAIMTTDTVAKALSQQVLVGGEVVTITGIAKGSGMIKPNMATMLGFVGCDANISQALLSVMVKDIADESFNRITVDGDTSTNDCFMVSATAQSNAAAIVSQDDLAYQQLREGLTQVAQILAQAIVRDGEGATKFVAVQVTGGASAQECLEVAYTVAESPLVKTALFAGDANWGRFCMAIGRAEVVDLNVSNVALWLNKVEVASGGLMSPTYTEAAGAGVMAEDEFSVIIDLGRGDASETIWTTDLSYEYVRINAEYRS
jgi:glutamate N-acetyltransferase/amino-acid N-acetyltransferase|tara:strand:- start:2085 stop:3299 length:1215 start_codon:yes stop_codon:yes gene_type:complete